MVSLIRFPLDNWRKSHRRHRSEKALLFLSEIGNEPDERGQELMRKKGIPMSHVARQITADDYRKFDFIFGMDEDNLSNLKRKKPSNSTSVVDFLGSFDPKGEKIIHDPYYGSLNDFVKVYEQCLRCCTAFLEKES